MNDIKPNYNTPVPIYYQGAEDEISLVDLMLVLIRRKTVIGLSIVICLALALGYAFARPQIETYTTILKVGGGTTPIEPTQRAVAKLTENYIPTSKKELDLGYEVKIRSPDGANLIILETLGATKNKEEVEKLHEVITQKLLKDHAALIETQRTPILTEIDRLSQTINQINNSSYLLSLTTNIESTRKELLKQDISDKYRESLKDVLRSLQTELASNEQNNTLRLIELQTQLNDLKRELRSLTESNLLTQAIAEKKEGKSPLIFAALGIILGLMLGIFLAFFLELVAKVKAAQETQG